MVARTRQMQCLSHEGSLLNHEGSVSTTTAVRQCLRNEGGGNTKQRQCLSREGSSARTQAFPHVSYYCAHSCAAVRLHSQPVAGKRLETPGGQRHLWVCRPIYIEFFGPTLYICMLPNCINAAGSLHEQFRECAKIRAKPRNLGHCNGPQAIVT